MNYEQRARREAREAAAVRKRLEGNSSGGTRADITQILNKAAAGHAEREQPGLKTTAPMRGR